MNARISVLSNFVLILCFTGLGFTVLPVYSQSEEIPDETIDMTLPLTDAEITELQEIGVTDERVQQIISNRPYEVTCCGFGGHPLEKAKYFSFWVNLDDMNIAIAVDLETHAVSNIIISPPTYLGDTVISKPEPANLGHVVLERSVQASEPELNAVDEAEAEVSNTIMLSANNTYMQIMVGGALGAAFGAVAIFVKKQGIFIKEISYVSIREYQYH